LSAEAFDQIFGREGGVVLVGVTVSVARGGDAETVRERGNSGKSYGVRMAP
jgi:hypothetical protein